MSELVKLEFKKEIEKLEKELADLNDAVSFSKRTSKEITAIIQNAIMTANASESIDQRISILATTLQGVVDYTGNKAADVEDVVLRTREKIKYLNDFSKKIDSLVDEEKKIDSIEQEQKI